jgi:hypothetical protein
MWDMAVNWWIFDDIQDVVEATIEVQATNEFQEGERMLRIAARKMLS